MALTETAERMLGYFAPYYDGEPTWERFVQAEANEVDRIDALLDLIEMGMQPGSATGEILKEWERILALPVDAAGVSVPVRQGLAAAAFQSLDSNSSASVLALLTAVVGEGGFTIDRNTPTQLSDTITIPFEVGSFTASQIEVLVRKLWPAHRGLFMGYVGGFLLDISRLDYDVL